MSPFLNERVHSGTQWNTETGNVTRETGNSEVYVKVTVKARAQLFQINEILHFVQIKASNVAYVQSKIAKRIILLLKIYIF